MAEPMKGLGRGEDGGLPRRGELGGDGWWRMVGILYGSGLRMRLRLRRDCDGSGIIL